MYKYYNQLDPKNEIVWGHLSKDVQFGEQTVHMDRDLTISANGCGLCSAVMVVENLTGKEFPLPEIIKVAQEWNYGSSGKTLCEMKVLAPVLAEMFDLRFSTTSVAEEMLQWVQQGGMVIAHSSGDRPGHTGIMTHGAHYVAVVRADGEELTVLDPSLKEGKFDSDYCRSLVAVDGNEVHINYAVLADDCVGKLPRFYMFAKRK